MSRWQTILMLAPSVILLVVVLVLVTAEEPPPPPPAQAPAARAVADFTVVGKVTNRSAGAIYVVIMFAGREREVSMYRKSDDCYDTPIGAVLPRRCR